MHIGETGGGEINRAFPMLNSAIDEKYEMERVWNTGGKNYFVLHERIHNTQRMLLMYTVSPDRYEGVIFHLFFRVRRCRTIPPAPQTQLMGKNRLLVRLVNS